MATAELWLFHKLMGIWYNLSKLSKTANRSSPSSSRSQVLLATILTQWTCLVARHLYVKQDRSPLWWTTLLYHREDWCQMAARTQTRILMMTQSGILMSFNRHFQMHLITNRKGQMSKVLQLIKSRKHQPHYCPMIPNPLVPLRRRTRSRIEGSLRRS